MIELDGVSTYYEHDGAGPPLLLLHGGFNPIETLAPQRAALAPAFTVYLPERRGHGRTPDGAGPISYGLMTADTVAFLDALGLATVDVVGYSDGAIIGLLLAI